MTTTRDRITKKRIFPERLLREVKADSAGGTVVFIGTIRNRSKHGTVAGLEYQVYRRMAEKRMKKIESDVARKWPVSKVRLVHREGSLKVGDVSVVVAVSAEHRAEAFEACRYAIDRVKSTLPIWKKEKLGRSGTWVEGSPIESQLAAD